MGFDVGDEIALATAGLIEGLGSWQFLAREAADSNAFDVLGQFSQVVVELTHAVAELGALGGTPAAVPQQLALSSSEATATSRTWGSRRLDWSSTTWQGMRPPGVSVKLVSGTSATVRQVCCALHRDTRPTARYCRICATWHLSKAIGIAPGRCYERGGFGNGVIEIGTYRMPAHSDTTARFGRVNP